MPDNSAGFTFDRDAVMWLLIMHRFPRRITSMKSRLEQKQGNADMLVKFAGEPAYYFQMKSTEIKPTPDKMSVITGVIQLYDYYLTQKTADYDFRYCLVLEGENKMDIVQKCLLPLDGDPDTFKSEGMTAWLKLLEIREEDNANFGNFFNKFFIVCTPKRRQMINEIPEDLKDGIVRLCYALAHEPEVKDHPFFDQLLRYKISPTLVNGMRVEMRDEVKHQIRETSAFKILHFSDLHFGASSVESEESYTGEFKNYVTFFMTHLETCLVEKPLLVLVSGDIGSKGNAPPPDQFKDFVEFFSSKGIPVLVSNGNHDLVRDLIDDSAQFDQFVLAMKGLPFRCEMSTKYKENQSFYHYIPALKSVFISLNSCKSNKKVVLAKSKKGGEMLDQKEQDRSDFPVHDAEFVIEEFFSKHPGLDRNMINIFIVIHHPVELMDNKDALGEFLKKMNIRGFFSGHEHKEGYYVENRKNFITGSPFVREKDRHDPTTHSSIRPQFNEYRIEPTENSIRFLIHENAPHGWKPNAIKPEYMGNALISSGDSSTPVTISESPPITTDLSLVPPSTAPASEDTIGTESLISSIKEKLEQFSHHIKVILWQIDKNKMRGIGAQLGESSVCPATTATLLNFLATQRPRTGANASLDIVIEYFQKWLFYSKNLPYGSKDVSGDPRAWSCNETRTSFETAAIIFSLLNSKMNIDDAKFKDEIKQGIEYLLEIQDESGGWGLILNHKVSINPFFTAVVILTLMISWKHSVAIGLDLGTIRKSVSKGLQYCLKPLDIKLDIVKYGSDKAYCNTIWCAVWAYSLYKQYCKLTNKIDPLGVNQKARELIDGLKQDACIQVEPVLVYDFQFDQQKQFYNFLPLMIFPLMDSDDYEHPFVSHWLRDMVDSFSAANGWGGGGTDKGWIFLSVYSLWAIQKYIDNNMPDEERFVLLDESFFKDLELASSMDFITKNNKTAVFDQLLKQAHVAPPTENRNVPELNTTPLFSNFRRNESRIKKIFDKPLIFLSIIAIPHFINVICNFLASRNLFLEQSQVFASRGYNDAYSFGLLFLLIVIYAHSIFSLLIRYFNFPPNKKNEWHKWNYGWVAFVNIINSYFTYYFLCSQFFNFRFDLALLNASAQYGFSIAGIISFVFFSPIFFYYEFYNCILIGRDVTIKSKTRSSKQSNISYKSITLRNRTGTITLFVALLMIISTFFIPLVISISSSIHILP